MSEFRLNRLFSRPLSSLFLKTPLTPNQITTLSIASGVAAGVLFSFGRYFPGLAAAALYELAVILDNCDGEVARAKNMKSEFGGWLDVFGDFSTDLALFTGIGFGCLARGIRGPVVPFTFLCASGAFMHFVVVLMEKVKGFGPAVFGVSNPDSEKRKNALWVVFDAIREGDVSWFVPAFALFGKTEFLLWVGGIYMQLIWIVAVSLNFKWLFGKRVAG